MALDSMAQEIVTETLEQLQAAPLTHDTEILINPRRMRALILHSQQRMQLMFKGLRITLVEDSEAPDLASAIEAAVAHTPELPEPVVPPEPKFSAAEVKRAYQAQHPKPNGKNGKHAR